MNAAATITESSSGAWADAHPGEEVSAPAIDAHLHADRLRGPSVRRTYTAAVGDLPAGTMVDHDGRPWLVLDGGLLAWGPSGYAERQRWPPATRVTVITPRATVATLVAGYRPILHPTSGG